MTPNSPRQITYHALPQQVTPSVMLPMTSPVTFVAPPCPHQQNALAALARAARSVS